MMIYNNQERDKSRNIEDANVYMYAVRVPALFAKVYNSMTSMYIYTHHPCIPMRMHMRMRVSISACVIVCEKKF